MLIHAAFAISMLLSAPQPELATDSAVWIPVGPTGGDVRSLAADPAIPGRVYLGAAGGQLYRSDNGGDSWQRPSPGFPRRDQNLDDLVVSPNGDLLIGFWDVHRRGGGVAVSSDQGRTFAISLDGESVRALTVAPSDPSQVVAGALSGVFASSDGGRHWRRITPVGHSELRQVESVAVDPRDPRTIYVGTWHLPWKTTDGGETWSPVHRGMIDDSDVFTMTLDARDPQRVYATACSGIYSSRDGAGTWSRVRGIPSSSRRSRAFAQDPARSSTFYAGTTEGLWISDDDGSTFRLSSRRDLVVNAIATLSDGSVLVGADGAGVLRSRDRGLTWTAVNEGFSERFISRIVFDGTGGRVLASVWGDRTHGGVFSAPGPQGPWTPLGAGLRGRDVVSLALAGAVVLAGTDQGLFALEDGASVWRKVELAPGVQGPAPRVNDIKVLRHRVVLVGASDGLYRSDNAAASWSRVVVGMGDITAVSLAAGANASLAAHAGGLLVSEDEGREWRAVSTVPWSARVNAIAASHEPGLSLVATSRGLFRSKDGGRSWLPAGRGLPDSDFTSIAVEIGGQSFFVSDFTYGGVYRTEDGGDTWVRLGATGLVTDRVWALAFSPKTGELLGASAAAGLHLAQWPNSLWWCP
jgi:photosystem II stability/assembly factor-like uncharacterized protein